MTDLSTLLRNEKKHVALARKGVEAARDVLVDLARDRIAIGRAMVEEKKKAQKAEVPWPQWCDERLPFKRQQADKYARFAASEKEVLKLARSGELSYNLSNAVKLLPSQAEAKNLAYASGGNNGRDSDHWLTPAEYTDAAREVMGSIDFDPFSSPEGNELVGAGRFYTPEEDAFEMPWPDECLDTVWMNPPYGRKRIHFAVDVFLEHLPRIGSAIVLVNNATDTAWWDRLATACAAVVFTRGRISFISPDEDRKTLSANTRGQCFMYFGNDPQEFCRVFSEFGFCWEKYCA